MLSSAFRLITASKRVPLRHFDAASAKTAPQKQKGPRKARPTTLATSLKSYFRGPWGPP